MGAPQYGATDTPVSGSGWLVGWLVGWLAGWLTDWLVGWLVGWLVWFKHYILLGPRAKLKLSSCSKG